MESNGVVTKNALIRYLEAFGEMEPKDKDLLESSFSFRTYREGEDLCVAGDVCREMYFISAGVLKIFLLNEDGDEIVHYFLKENQFCSVLTSFVSQTPGNLTIRAATDVEVIVLPYETLMSVYQRLPHLKTLIDEIIQRGLLNKIEIRNSYLGEDATTRYQNFLIRQPEIALRVSLGDIASYLGIAPQSLSRIRKNLV